MTKGRGRTAEGIVGRRTANRRKFLLLFRTALLQNLFFQFWYFPVFQNIMYRMANYKKNTCSITGEIAQMVDRVPSSKKVPNTKHAREVFSLIEEQQFLQ